MGTGAVDLHVPDTSRLRYILSMFISEEERPLQPFERREHLTVSSVELLRDALPGGPNQPGEGSEYTPFP